MHQKVHTIQLLVSILLVINGLAACASPVGIETPPQVIPPEQDEAILVGRLVSFPEKWQGMQLYAYAAPYLGPEDGEGIFILDENLHPKGSINDNGWFQVRNVQDGVYILVVGPDSEQGLALRDNGIALRFFAIEGEVLDIGEFTISP